MGRVKVLFVCMGNICRSPTAHGVFEALVKREGLGERIVVDSAGTHAYHVGEQPDPRSQSTARARGFDLSHLRARKAEAVDFDHFDYVLAMDSDNYANLSAICPQGMQDKLQMFLDFAPHLGIQDVPDPYYGGSGGFERVFDMVEAASEGLLADIRRRYL
ncbi:MAG: low molecular weight protein-tyrosine-phosphatase [Sedimenticola sp.]